MRIKIGDEHFSAPQVTLLLKLKEGERSTRELLSMIRRFGFHSKSSFYVSLTDLQERGYVDWDKDGAVKITEKGMKEIKKIVQLIKF